jgi:hypothetical protein
MGSSCRTPVDLDLAAWVDVRTANALLGNAFIIVQAYMWRNAPVFFWTDRFKTLIGCLRQRTAISGTLKPVPRTRLLIEDEAGVTTIP